jgi:hypothetical protein
MIPDPAPPFDVKLVGTAHRDILDLMARAGPRGLRLVVEQLLAQINAELHQRPRGWGDPIRNHPALEAVQYRGRAGFLLAYYSVHDRLPWVYLSKVTPPKGHPLERGGS